MFELRSGRSDPRRKLGALLLQVSALALCVALPTVGTAQGDEDTEDFEVYGEISSSAEKDPEEKAKAKLTPAFRKALEEARKRHCGNDGILFPFEWQGEIETHGCKVEEQRCYVDSKLKRPGSIWKCGKQTCECGEDGQIRKAPRGSKRK